MEAEVARDPTHEEPAGETPTDEAGVESSDDASASPSTDTDAAAVIPEGAAKPKSSKGKKSKKAKKADVEAEVVKVPLRERIRQNIGVIFIAISVLNSALGVMVGIYSLKVFTSTKDKPHLEDLQIETPEEGEAKEEKAAVDPKTGKPLDPKDLLPGVGEGEKGKYARYTKMEPFSVNLLQENPDEKPYLRINVQIDVKTRELHKEFLAKEHIMRATIIDILNSRTQSDFATIEGRNFTRKQILEALNRYLEKGKIRSVQLANWQFGN